MPDESARPPTPTPATTPSSVTPACVRCRSFKKKCSRTFPSCTLCTAAGQSCSYAPPLDHRLRNRHLQARVAWLTAYINRNPPVGGFAGGRASIDQVETGANLVDAVRNRESDRRELRARPQLTGTSTSPPVSSSVHGHDGSRVLESVDASVCGTDTTSPSSVAVAAITAKALIDGFFSHVGRSYPCVDREAVLAILNTTPEPFELPATFDEERTILYLVMASGADSLQRVGRLPSGPAQALRIDYASILHHCLLRPSLATVQMLVLLVLNSFADPEYPATWTVASIASRQAMDLGLTIHNHAHVMDRDEESERRHRLFWSVYVLDRRMAISLGVQPMIRPETVDVPSPRLTVNEFTSRERGKIASGLQITQQGIEICRLEEKIFSRIHLQPVRVPTALSPEVRRDATEEIRLEIENWYSKWCLLPVSEEIDAIAVQSSVSWLSGRYYHLLTLLYYPTHFHICDGADIVQKSVDMLDAATKYVRSVAILLQQSQLSLNRLTLCRLLPAGMMLIYGFLNVPAYPAREDVTALVEILEAYKPGWEHAHAAAGILRRFQTSFHHRRATGSRRDPSHPATWLQGPNRDGADAEGQACLADMLKLLQRFHGPTSGFCWGLSRFMDKAQSASHHGRIGSVADGGTMINRSMRTDFGGAYMGVSLSNSPVQDFGMPSHNDFANGYGDF